MDHSMVSTASRTVSIYIPIIISSLEYYFHMSLIRVSHAIYMLLLGGLIAALTAGIANDGKLRDAVLASPNSTSAHIKKTLIPDRSVLGGSSGEQTTQTISRTSAARASVLGGGRKTTMGRKTNRKYRLTSVLGGRASLFGGGGMTRLVSQPVAIGGAPFEFVICACAGLSALSDVGMITCTDNIGVDNRDGGEDGLGMLVDINSVHIIGIEDSLKTQSEAIAGRFMNGKVMYLPGGHSISREHRSDADLIDSIKEVVHTDGSTDGLFNILAEFNEVNPVTSISVHPTAQISRVQLKTELLPSGKHGGTIIDCLKAQPADKPFLFDARNPTKVSTTYGQAYDFIRGGLGDLRRLGVKPGEVIAYGAPPGGGAPAALAFLCIGAQTTAAPLAPGKWMITK